MSFGQGRSWAWAAAVGLAVAGASTAAEPPKLAGETPRTASRFLEAAALESERRWSDAVDLYLRLLEEAGDDLVPADDNPRHLLPARTLVHRRVAVRPELLAPYRDRVEPRAKRLLEAGQAGHDPGPLRQLVEQYFCSRSAEAALHLLGDLACEGGQFDAARRYWHLLEPAESGGLAYPDPHGGPALARAKQVVALLLAGDRPAAATAVAAFRKDHPAATGHLAGRDGNLATLLEQLLALAETVRVPTAVGVAPAPTTFAGDGGRNGLLPGLLPPFAPEPRYPPIVLSGPTTGRSGGRRSVTRLPALAYYPLIAHGQVFVADGRRVTAYDLATGQRSGQFDGSTPEDDVPGRTSPRPPPDPGPGYTLTVDGDRIYARFGPATVRPKRDGTGSVLICLRWRPGAAAADRLTARWTLRPPTPSPDATAAWEGPPVVRDGRLYAAVTRLDGPRAVTSIAAYDADDPSAGPVWQKDSYEAAGDTVDRTRQLLLTIAGPNIALCSHAGVIVAVEATTGRRAWAYRYPPSQSATVRGWAGPRDPAPCVAADGRLYAAPADADGVVCLDAASGAKVWTNEPLEVAHLLGVAGGRVVCELGGFHAGMCGLDVSTGRRLGDWGYRVAGAEALAPLGRGLLCGDRVYWPTRAHGLKELRWDGTSGYPPTAFRELPGGNLAYGDGCLVVATANRLHILVGDRPATPHDVGQAAADHDLLVWRAEALSLAGRPAAEVRATFDAAAGTEFPPERRFLAMVRRAEFERQAGNGDPESSSAQMAEISRVMLRDADGVIRSARDRASAGTAGPNGDYENPDPEYRRPVGRRLRFPLRPAWRVSLNRDEWVLLPEGDAEISRLFVAGRRWIACRTRDGAELWRRELAFAPGWLATSNGSIVIAGDQGAARLAVNDGRREWEFELPGVAPWFDRPGWHDRNAVPPAERLSGFRHAGGRLLARLGERSLLALDSATGEVRWQRLAPFEATFQAPIFADGHTIVAHLSDGRCTAYDMADGHLVHTASAPPGEWPDSPVSLSDRLLVVVEDGRLVAYDRTTWEPAWARELTRPSSLTGEPPHVRLVGGQLLVGVRRNDCYEIERRDPANGLPVGEPIAVGHEPVDFGSVALAGEVLHVVTAGKLRSFDVRTTRPVGRTRLGDNQRWRIEPSADGLILWTVPTVSPFEPPQPGRVLIVATPTDARRAPLDLAVGSGTVRSVRTVGNELVVATDTEVRAFRGAGHEAK